MGQLEQCFFSYQGSFLPYRSGQWTELFTLGHAGHGEWKGVLVGVHLGDTVIWPRI